MSGGTMENHENLLG